MTKTMSTNHGWTWKTELEQVLSLAELQLLKAETWILDLNSRQTVSYPLKKDLRSCKDEPSILKFLSFWYKIWWSTQSNALQKSKNIATVICFCYLSVTSDKILWTELVQECPVRNPACKLWMALFFVRKFVKQIFTCFSKTFDNIGRMEIISLMEFCDFVFADVIGLSWKK